MAEYTMCSRCEEKPAAICLSCLTDYTLKQQPIEGELTKKIRKFVKMYENEIPKRAEINFLEEACDRLDSAEARLKELLAALEEAARDFYYIHQHPEGAHTDSYNFMEKVKQAKKIEYYTTHYAAPDLLSVCNDILLALKKIKNTQKIDPFYLDILIAVLDSTILKQSGCRPPVEGETDNPDPLPEQQSKKEG